LDRENSIGRARRERDRDRIPGGLVSADQVVQGWGTMTGPRQEWRSFGRVVDFLSLTSGLAKVGQDFGASTDGRIMLVLTPGNWGILVPLPLGRNAFRELALIFVQA
jgi:hypothetical protein